ncbi:MAG: class I SAM-dependent methyltransferase [Acidobacteria bacterium]|nr:class I SAM-dependent methyltransferase [Acidobacteriota bacterium]
MDRLLQATARAERDHFWFKGFRRFMAPLVREAARGRSHPRLLDCGCGTGHNLLWLREYGESTGIDLTWTGLSFARTRGERRIAQATAASLPFPDSTFDVVTSFDVIYALDDAVEGAALAEMFRVLRPGGFLVLNVAAMDLLKGNHSVLAHEVRRYSRASLSDRLTGAGFDIRRMSYTNATILPIVAGVRLLQRVSGHEESNQEISIPPAPINAALTAALAIEAGLLRVVNMPFGSSLMALARRPSS